MALAVRKYILLCSDIRRCAAAGAQFVLHHQYQPKRNFARERDVSVSVLCQIGGQDSIADCASALFVIYLLVFVHLTKF